MVTSNGEQQIEFELQSADKKWVDEIWNKLDRKLSCVAPRTRGKIPYSSKNGVFDDKGSWPLVWTNGFWPGLMWLMYAATGKELYADCAAESQSATEKALKLYDRLSHDVGFMFDITACVRYRLTGDERAKQITLLAANTLAGRFKLKGNFIRAWDGEWNGMETKGISIVDCMMNLPLLYRASEITGDERYRDIAEAHADTAMRYHVRPDGSVNHIIEFDENGEYIRALPGQGYGEMDNAWSRGQAWGIYGFILSYIHTSEQRYLDAAKRIAHYFIANLYSEAVPLCDFRAPERPILYDTSAGAAAACGLIEIARAVPRYEKRMYLAWALKILRELTERFADFDEATDSVLGGGCEMYDAKEQLSLIYGDYYYTEAFSKLKGFNMLMW